jgi:hypothetical protein
MMQKFVMALNYAVILAMIPATWVTAKAIKEEQSQPATMPLQFDVRCDDETKRCTIPKSQLKLLIDHNNAVTRALINKTNCGQET